ncbi:MAG TPA: ribonuclease H-like domain-containing protein [Candidatus Binatia bacterium]|nr:ribonuclease H-like domain-containing protein [Candidatus Binatia bacterium]
MPAAELAGGTGGSLALADLRRRLAAMGGLADLSRPAPPRPRPAPVESPVSRAGRLGFVADAATLVRRVKVDLGPFLERAGAPGPATAEQLVRLLFRLPAAAPAGPFGEADLAVLDIETLGLRGSGVVPFLVGVGVPRGSSVEIDQWLLADLEAEPAMLDAIAARLASRRLLLTYNGRCFDLPVLQARCILNRRSPEAVAPPIHCDLLGPVRRLFRARLGACTLRQAEVCLLGLERVDDVPGAEAPARFRAWLGGAPASVLEGVVRHNQLDLCATLVLAARVAAHAAGDLIRPVHPADRYRLAVHLAALGMEDAAEAQLTSAFGDRASPWAQAAGHRLARFRRRGAWPAALPVLAELWRRDPADLAAARGLAITLERDGDIGGALRVCLEAERVLGARALWRRRLAVVPDARVSRSEDEWRRRGARLRRRAARQGPILLTGLEPAADRGSGAA